MANWLDLRVCGQFANLFASVAAGVFDVLEIFVNRRAVPGLAGRVGHFHYRDAAPAAQKTILAEVDVVGGADRSGGPHLPGDRRRLRSALAARPPIPVAIPQSGHPRAT